MTEHEIFRALVDGTPSISRETAQIVLSYTIDEYLEWLARVDVAEKPLQEIDSRLGPQDTIQFATMAEAVRTRNPGPLSGIIRYYASDVRSWFTGGA